MTDTGHPTDYTSPSDAGAGTRTGPGGSAAGHAPPGSVMQGGSNAPGDVRIIPGGSERMAHTGTDRIAASAEAIKANPPADLVDAIDHGYEPHDIALKGLFNFLAGLVVTIIISLFIVWGIISALLTHEANKDPINSPVLVAHDPIPYPLQPSLEHDTVDHQDMEAMRENVHQALDTAGVTTAGRRHITIREAMAQVLSLLPIQPSTAAGSEMSSAQKP